MQLAAVPWKIPESGPTRIVLYNGGERAAAVSIANNSDVALTLLLNSAAAKGDRIPPKSSIVVVTSYAAVEGPKGTEVDGFMGVSFPPSA